MRPTVRDRASSHAEKMHTSGKYATFGRRMLVISTRKERLSQSRSKIMSKDQTLFDFPFQPATLLNEATSDLSVKVCVCRSANNYRPLAIPGCHEPVLWTVLPALTDMFWEQNIRNPAQVQNQVRQATKKPEMRIAHWPDVCSPRQRVTPATSAAHPQLHTKATYPENI